MLEPDMPCLSCYKFRTYKVAEALETHCAQNVVEEVIFEVAKLMLSIRSFGCCVLESVTRSGIADVRFWKFAVTAVDSGRRALQFLGLDDEEKRNNKAYGMKVDLIITDYCMPGMTGYELLKKIKESSVFREVPVVIMSSENINTRIDRCLEEGAEDYIVKPVKLSDVRRLKDYMMMKEDRSIVKESGINKRKLKDGCDLSTSAPSLCTARLCPQSSPAQPSSSLVSLSS